MLNIQAGSVITVWCTHCTPTKWKYYVVAFVDGSAVRYMLINSRPAAFQQGSPLLMGHQVSLGVDDNKFLHHPSVLDCSQIVGGPTVSELEDLYQKDPSISRGRIGTAGRRAVRKIVGESSILSAKDIKAVLAVW